MIDVNASLGRWPFRRLRYATPPAMLRQMDQLAIERACVAPIEALLYLDVQEANREMARAIRRHRDRLLFFPSINPAWPDWQTDLDECIEKLGATGVRLFPSYHNYRINDRPCLELLAELERRDLPVQIATVVADPRMHHPAVMVPAVRLDPLADLLRLFPRLRIAILNATGIRETVNPKTLGRTDNLFFDVAFADGVACVDDLIDALGRGRILLGTNAPMMIGLGAVYKLRESRIEAGELRRLLRENALRFLSRRGKGDGGRP